MKETLISHSESTDIQQQPDVEAIQTKQETGSMKLINADIAFGLVKTGKLSTDQLLEIGKSVDDEKVWDEIIILLKLDELSTDQLLEVGNKANNSSLWSLILDYIRFDKLPTDQLLEIVGKAAYNEGVWIFIEKNVKLSTDQLLEIGKSANDETVWREVIHLLKWDELSTDQLLEVGKSANNEKVWRTIIKQLS